MFGEDTIIGLKFKLADNSAYVLEVDDEAYTIGELVKIIGEVDSLRKENVALNKDRSALQNINEGLQKQVHNYQDVIANNLTGIRCKELEGEVEQLKQQVSDLEEIIRDGMGTQSDEIHNLQTKLTLLKDACNEVLDDNVVLFDKYKNQQATIEFQKNDIERLVKLNAELFYENGELEFALSSCKQEFDEYKRDIYRLIHQNN